MMEYSSRRGKSEIHRTNQSEIKSEIPERIARFRAMPLRYVTAPARDGRCAVLNCGHWAIVLMWLPLGERVRCRDCFALQMQKTQEMVEQACGPVDRSCGP